jgi:CheY-like chemotaxis protein
MEKAKILIVEDEAIIAMELESQLQGLGYEVTSIVDTGEKAIKKTILMVAFHPHLGTILVENQEKFLTLK